MGAQFSSELVFIESSLARKVLQLLRLKQLHNGVFLKALHRWPLEVSGIAAGRSVTASSVYVGSGEQAHPEHAEAGAALCHLRLSVPKDGEGVDLQAWLWEGRSSMPSKWE